MFPRKAYAALTEWKTRSQGHTAMLIEGARRVGKSSLAERFARDEYARHLLIDFSKAAPEVIDLFRNQRHDIDAFYRYLFAYHDIEPIDRDTLIILDEVQLCPQARSFTKHLVADGRYDIMETGSLISIRRNVKDILIPSEEESIDLDPFDFEEFLWAVGARPLAELIRDSFDRLEPLPELLHRKAERLFREYMLVGGMPQAIQAYVDTNSFHEADRAKRGILRLYREDIAKYGEGEESRVSAIFNELPAQLAKHEKKFRMASLGVNARHRDYEGAFFWLADARLVNMCFNSTDPSIGLGLNMDQSSFKCYMADTGLLATHALADDHITTEDLYRDILFGKLEVNEGMLVENVVAQQLKASGHRLFFLTKSDPATSRNRLEIDFLIRRPYGDAAGRYRISPIEVKSTKRYRTSSLDKMRERWGKRIGTEYVLHPKPLHVDGNRIYLPLYMAGML